MADNHLLKSSGLFLFRHVSLLQGCYYLINGIWPLWSNSSFQAVTGPKTDLWLVKAVGLLLWVNGAILILAAYRRQIDLPVTALGIGTALALIGVEVAYVFSGVISVVYLMDAFVEALFVISWFSGKRAPASQSAESGVFNGKMKHLSIYKTRSL